MKEFAIFGQTTSRCQEVETDSAGSDQVDFRLNQRPLQLLVSDKLL